MWITPEILPVAPEPGPPELPEGSPPDALDGRLGEPPVWPSTLSRYISAHSAAHTQLTDWHGQVSATTTALVEQRLWEGADQQAQATSWTNLGARHIEPAKVAMQGVQEALTTFRTSLAKVRQEARYLLRKADAHMQRAQEWQRLAQERVTVATQRVAFAQASLDAAVASAGATLGATSGLVAERTYELEEAVREEFAAQKWLAESFEDGARAEAERAMARDAAQTGYHTADGVATEALSAIKTPGATDGAQTPTGAEVKEWKPTLPPYAVPMQGQIMEQSCGPAGVQNALGAIGIDPGQRDIIALSNMNPEGTTLPKDAAIMNSYLRNNPDAVGRHFGWDSPQYQAALNGQDLVTFKRISIDQLAASTNTGLPSMVPVPTADGGWHSINVMGVDKKGGKVYVWDSLPQPDGRGRMESLDQFMQHWPGYGSVLTTV